MFCFFTVYSPVIFTLMCRILLHSCLKIGKKLRSENCKHFNTIQSTLARENIHLK